MGSITLAQIRESLPDEKNRADSLWTRRVLRPVSIPVAWFFLKIGFTANAVSYLSALMCIPAGILFGSHSFAAAAFGVLLFNFFALFDCADGNMARATGTTGPYGGWADALGGYVAYVAVLLSLGYAAAVRDASVFGWSPEGELWVLFGGLAAGTNLLMRLAYQSYRNIAPEGEAGVKKSISFEKLLSENLGITGILMPVLLVGLVLKGLGYVLIFYTFFYGLGCLVTLVKLMWKVEHAARTK